MMTSDDRFAHEVRSLLQARPSGAVLVKDGEETCGVLLDEREYCRLMTEVLSYREMQAAGRIDADIDDHAFTRMLQAS